MSPGGGNFQGSLHRLLSPDLREVRKWKGIRRPGPGRGGGDGGLAGEVGGQLLHRLHRVDGEPLGQGGLRGAVSGDEQTLNSRIPGGQGHGEHPHHRAQGARQGELPHKSAVGVRPGQLPAGGQDAHADGQVVNGAGLTQVGRGQVHGDPPHREGIAVVLDGGADPFPGLFYGGVRQAHNVKIGQTAGQVALRGYLVTGNALEPKGAYLIQHNSPPSPVQTIYHIHYATKRGEIQGAAYISPWVFQK